MNTEAPLPVPEVVFLDGEFGRICWDSACADMDDMAEFALSHPLVNTRAASEALASLSVGQRTDVGTHAERV